MKISKNYFILRFLPLSEYDNKDHQLSQFTLADLNLSPVKTFEKSITIGDALNALQELNALPILENGNVFFYI